MALLSVLTALSLSVPLAAQPSASPAPPSTAASSKPAVADVLRELAQPRRAGDAEWKLVRDYPPAEVLAPLIAAINSDPDFASGKSGRAAAYVTLARIGEARVGAPRPTDHAQIAQLLAGLSEPEEKIRAASVTALGGVPGPDRGAMKQPLVDALNDSSLVVVASALGALRILALPESAPPEVWAIAATPTAEMKEKWLKGQSPLVASKAYFDGEVQMRLSAMSTIAAWEGLAKLYAPAVALDDKGTRARALTAAFILDMNAGRSGLEEASRETMLNEMVAFFKTSPVATLVEGGIVKALLKAAVNEENAQARDAAKSALQRCGEGVSLQKQDMVKQALNGLP